ncbi:vanadium-dependent haloperoxidase [Methyloprofundus sp.]|uniref:vanadium-dependent haloperoxidase n=1 Tax=Methyloprofundus sp. TaxID=2020875 RepID=UPI003D0D5E7F
MTDNRKQQARQVRISAAELAYNREHPRHITNGDEQKFRNTDGSKPSYLASFTKGMPHNDDTGLVSDPNDFQQFVQGIDSGDPRDFNDTRLGRGEGSTDHPPGTIEEPEWRSTKSAGAKVRAWESQGAGNTYDLEGPDAHSLTMPPAPAIGSDELIAEMGEVYAQALLRDVPFTEIVDCSGSVNCNTCDSDPLTVNDIVSELNNLTWFSDNCCSLSAHEASRKRGKQSGQTVFRGITPGDDIGPYISQFLLVGNRGVNPDDKINQYKDGFISYGSIRADQRVRYAKPCEDHLTLWNEWLDVQEGADLGGKESYESGPEAYRFITTPRDMATYVHYDALYESYLNACLILLGEKTPLDPGIPFQRGDHLDHQQGFAHFGGPHILSLVTEVATRALKAVRHQKFNVHRRLRPEALAARLSKHADLCVTEIDTMVCQLQPILRLISARNPKDKALGKCNYLLPMAFCEGSPMHPAYGAGHATVAGACVTILKAFFDHKHPLTMAGGDTQAFVPTTNGMSLKCIDVVGGKLTVEGELNKLASNISTGRDWAGVHYFTDYIESLRMGEQIAIGILEEQKLTFAENFSMTVPLFDGGSIRI